MKSTACKAEVQNGARCRNKPGDDGFCSAHKHGSKIIGRPHRVKLGININKRRADLLIQAGVEERQPNFAAKEVRHQAQADELGRKGDRYQTENRRVVDSGTPVYEGGLKNCSIYLLFRFLLDLFNVVDIYIQPTRPGGNPNMRVLVIWFSNDEQRQGCNEKTAQEVLSFLAASCWGVIHVWSNGKDANGVRTDTIMPSHRQEGQEPERVLRFGNGQWPCDEIVPGQEPAPEELEEVAS